MQGMSTRNKLIIFFVAILICYFIGYGFANLYQPVAKTKLIYSHALQDYSKGEYQNSYYLFSRISFTSKLKPYAIYRQAMCAKELGDKKSEIKQYRLLFNNYPKNKLSLKAKYSLAQLILDEDPEQSRRYFEQIIKENPNTDYAIASEYYIGVILLNKYKTKKIFPNSVKDDIEMAFRHYIESAPQGRLALNAIKNWESLNKDISKDDYLLMANTYYLFWVVDFPMFEKNVEDQKIVATHHPFTRPKDESIQYLDTNPLNVLSYAYDIVINGYEAGGGTLRIYDQDMQQKIFEILGLSDDEIKEKFGYFIEALKYGTPPHAGMAFGLDRLAMILGGTDNIRDVIAFPKNLAGVCPMSGAPTKVSQSQLDELGLIIKDYKETK